MSQNQFLINKRIWKPRGKHRGIFSIKKNQPVKVSDIVSKLENCSINTIKKDLQYLVAENLIEKIGKGRGTMYLFNEEKT